MHADDEDPHPLRASIAYRHEIDWKKYRVILTFLPAVVVGIFDPLLGFCFFIMLFEKSFLSMLGLPGLEFTTMATFLFGLKYDLATAAFLAFLIPNFLIRPIKFVLWREYVSPDEGPVNLSISALIDALMPVVAYALRDMNIFVGLTAALTVKHTLNVIRTRNSDKPEVFNVPVSFVSNLVLLLITYRLVLWLLEF